MTTDRLQFIKTILPESVNDVEYTNINLDSTDLGIIDIIRNLRKTYPKHSRFRNRIDSGELVICILCQSELLDPLNGVFLFIGGPDLDINIISSKYLVLNISSGIIDSEIKLLETLDAFTSYLIENYADVINSIGLFYQKYVYDPAEDDEMVYFNDYDDE